MSDVCHDVGVEPALQPITNERLHHSTTNTKDGACVNIKAQGFWENDRQCAFFDDRVFNPLAHTYRSLPLTTCHRRHEQEKKRAYDQRTREVEHGCFSPRLFSVGWYGTCCQSCVQEASMNDCSQIVNPTVKRLTGFIAGSTSLLNHVHKGLMFISTPPSQTCSIWSCHWPCPLWHQGGLCWMSYRLNSSAIYIVIIFTTPIFSLGFLFLSTRITYLSMFKKRIKWPWAEPFEMNVKIEQGSDFVIGNRRWLFFDAQEAKKVSKPTVVQWI